MSKQHTCSIVWFRRDLRLSDNHALRYAVDNSEAVVPLFIWSPDEEDWSPGAAACSYWHHLLEEFSQQISEAGSKLIIRQGNSSQNLLDVVEETGATLVTWNRLYEPSLVERDKKIKSSLKEKDIEAVSRNSLLLTEPWDCPNKSGKPYQVFTPYWRTLRQHYEHKELCPSVRKVHLYENIDSLESLEVSALELTPEISWDDSFYDFWNLDAKSIQEQLKDFLAERAADYKEARDIPSKDGTSRLSAALHYGQIGPREIWDEVDCYREKGVISEAEAEVYKRQLAWRDFAHQLLFNFPHSSDSAMKEEYETFPWKKNASQLEAWQKGQTGYPIIDAGMRQLWQQGWMHNRVRMIVGSFLVKNLLQPWQSGASWFWDTLVDADLANNSMGWQWVAGSGADAAPYFRVFNPVLQGERFDKQGEYIRQWVPELSKVPSRWIHKVWECPQDVLDEIGLELGEEYPKPIVNLKDSRDDALEAYQKFKDQS